MNGKLEDGKLYESAMCISAEYGFDLTNIEWYDVSMSMRINYRMDFRTDGLELKVYGIPTDIPIEVFEDLLHNMFKTKIKGLPDDSIKMKTKSWLNEQRLRHIMT